MFILTQGPNFETDDKSKTWISALRERLFSPAVEVRQKGDYSLALNGNFIIYSKNYDKCQKSIWKRDLQDFKLIEGDKFVYLDFWGTDRYLLLTKMGNIFIDGLVLHNVKAVVSSSTKTLLSSVDTHGIKLLDQCVPENFNDILEAKLENDCLLVKSADGSTFCFLESEEKELIDFYAGLGEFDKAIQVSKALLLDYQLLLKAKWKSSYAQKYLSIETLTEITDKRWVLEACICDLPDTTPKIRDLLKFGLSLTDHLSAAIIESELEKILDGTKDTYEEISPLEFYSYRLKFLTGLDRLNTFEGLHSSEISFGKSKSKKFSIVTEFKKFWTVDILEFAAQMSFRGEASKLELLFTRHGSSLLKYRLFLLDLLPLIMDPSKYGMLLPKMRGDKTIPWNEIPWRRPDWSESKNLKELESMLNDLPSPLPSNEFPEPANVVLKWFENRILELESVAGQPSLAHELALLGIQNGIDLNQVTTNMQLISSINQFGAQVTLEEFELLSVYEKLNLLLEGCGLQDVSKLLLNDVFPYFNRLKVDYQFDLFEVLRKKIKHDPAYLVQIIEVLIQSNMEKVLEDLIHTAAFEDEILTCDYEFWSRVTLLLNKITPIHTDSVNIVGEESGWDDADFDVNFEIESAKPNQLPEYVDALQLMVNAGVFFQSHGILLKIGQVKLLKEEKGKSFVAKLLRQSKFLLSADDIQWQITLRSLLNFNDCGLFSQLTTLDIYTEIVMMALNFSSIFRV